jgi:hypothetical protein
MESEGSLPCSQEPATGSYPEQMKPVHTLTNYFLNTQININFPYIRVYPLWWPGSKNSPTATHACRKRQLKGVPGAWR